MDPGGQSPNTALPRRPEFLLDMERARKLSVRRHVWASSEPGGVSQRLLRGTLAAGGDLGKHVSGRKQGEATGSWRSPGVGGQGGGPRHPCGQGWSRCVSTWSAVSATVELMMRTQRLCLLPRACTQGPRNRLLCREHRSSSITLTGRHHGLKASSSRNPREQSERRIRPPAGNEPAWLAQACPPPPETRKVTIWFRLNHFTDKSQGGAGWGAGVG